MSKVLAQIETWSLNAVSEISDNLWDRATLASATAQLVLFNSAPAATRQGTQLTQVDTNSVGDQVPSNEDWALHGLGVQYQGTALRTSAGVQLILDFLRQSRFDITINGMAPIFEGVIGDFFGPSLFAHQPAATQDDYVALGQFFGFRKFNVPIPLQNKTKWQLNFFPVSAAGLDGDRFKFIFDRQKFRNS